MGRRRLLMLALGTQCALVLVAWVGSRVLAVPPQWGRPLRDTIVGLFAAGALAAVNYFVLLRAPSGWIVDGVRAVYDEVLVPVFAKLGPASIVVVGAAAGIGEEWLFRGVLQPVIGMPAAAAAFGLLHIGGRHMLAFGVWAAWMGLALGSLALATGGLIAPIVAHGVYDMLALEYIRRGARAA